MKRNWMLRLMVVAVCLLLSLFNVRSSMCFAQSLQFYYHGEPIENNATITIEAEEDDFGTLCCETNPADDPQNGLTLHNLTAGSISGKAQITITKNTLTDKSMKWCMGGLCEIFTENKFTKDYSVPASGSVLTQFDVTPTQYGELLATIDVRYNLVENARVYVRMVYSNPDEAGISVLSNDANERGTAQYDLSGRRMDRQPEHVLYIKGGKKYVPIK